MKITEYIIDDMYTVLGSSFDYSQFRNYYFKNNGDDFISFKDRDDKFEKYLNRLIKNKIIVKKNNEFEMNHREYLSEVTLPINIKNILNFFYNSFEYHDFIRMYEYEKRSFFNSHVKYENESYYCKKNAKWAKTSRDRAYFSLKKIIKDQTIKLSSDKLILIEELIKSKMYYIEKEDMYDVEIEKFIYIDGVFVFLQDR